MQNAENFHLSAIAPVGIVAAVSIKTTEKRKKENNPTSYAGPDNAKPFPPSKPQPFIVSSRVMIGFPPRLARGPMPPNMRAYPTR